MNDLDHLTVVHGDIVEPRRLWLASSNDWPDESDTDQHYAECLAVTNPIQTALACVAVMLIIGVPLGLAFT